MQWCPLAASAATEESPEFAPDQSDHLPNPNPPDHSDHLLNPNPQIRKTLYREPG